MYDNVGGEIRAIAVNYVVRNTCVVSLAVAVLMVMFIFLTGELGIALLLLAVGVLVIIGAYFHFRTKAMMLYAQGELVENVMIIKNIMLDKTKMEAAVHNTEKKNTPVLHDGT